MKKIHDILKSRKKHCHNKKHNHHEDVHTPVFHQPLFGKQGISTADHVLAKRASGEALERKKIHGEPVKPAPKGQMTAESLSTISTTRFFSARRWRGNDLKAPAISVKTEDTGSPITDSTEEDKQRIQRLRELLSDVINHPGAMTPHMFWVLFMKIAPHFSMATAGCVRISALFWLMLSYIKAKSKTKKRKLKEQLIEAAELMEQEDAAMWVKPRRR